MNKNMIIMSLLAAIVSLGSLYGMEEDSYMDCPEFTPCEIGSTDNELDNAGYKKLDHPGYANLLYKLAKEKHDIDQLHRLLQSPALAPERRGEIIDILLQEYAKTKDTEKLGTLLDLDNERLSSERRERISNQLSEILEATSPRVDKPIYLSPNDVEKTDNNSSNNRSFFTTLARYKRTLIGGLAAVCIGYAMYKWAVPAKYLPLQSNHLSQTNFTFSFL